jgi:hypothetical protein
VFEQGDPSKNIPMIGLSSYLDEEVFFVDIAWDVEFVKRLFGDLNRDLLRPLGDGKVIIISDSDEEEEVHEETAVDAEATPSATAGKSSTAASSATDADEDPWKMQDDNSDDLARSQDAGKSSGGGDEASSP